MEFINSRADVIRSENQQWLLARWNALRAVSSLALWQSLDTDELAPLSENLTFFDVIDHDGKPRFVSRFRGVRIVEAFGETGDQRSTKF